MWWEFYYFGHGFNRSKLHHSRYGVFSSCLQSICRSSANQQSIVLQARSLQRSTLRTAYGRLFNPSGLVGEQPGLFRRQLKPILRKGDFDPSVLQHFRYGWRRQHRLWLGFSVWQRADQIVDLRIKLFFAWFRSRDWICWSATILFQSASRFRTSVRRIIGWNSWICCQWFGRRVHHRRSRYFEFCSWN